MTHPCRDHTHVQTTPTRKPHPCCDHTHVEATPYTHTHHEDYHNECKTVLDDCHTLISMLSSPNRVRYSVIHVHT